MESSLAKVDELMHISRLMRAIAVKARWAECCFPWWGWCRGAGLYCPPVGSAITQEIIDVFSRFQRLARGGAIAPKDLTDF